MCSGKVHRLWNQTLWAQIPDPSLPTGCMALDKLLNFSVTSFSDL